MILNKKQIEKISDKHNKCFDQLIKGGEIYG